MPAEPNPSAPLRVLILGGSGVFGSRVARLISADPKIETIIAGRDARRLQQAARDIERKTAGAKISVRVFDRDTLQSEDLRLAATDLVIHAAGPFQGQDFEVARAALAAGAHYIDLADDRDFVVHFERMGRAAKVANRAAISGLSSVPAISSAAAQALAEGFSEIKEIRVGIAPGNRAPRGRAVIEGILKGVGQIGEQRKGGDRIVVHGWQDLHRRALKVAGRRTLRRWFSHCDVSDGDLLAERYPAATTITFHAGLELSVLHLGLWLLSWLVRWRLIDNLARFTVPLEFIANLLRPFGSDKGGMFVEVVGRAGAQWVKRCWTLHAGKGDGPMIPAIPAAIVARAIAAGRAPAPGARNAAFLLSLESIEDAFAPFDIKTQRTETVSIAPLFAQVLGETFAALPAPVRALHTGPLTRRLGGEGSIKRGSHVLSGLLCRLLGLPIASDSVPVTVMIEESGSGETWTRSFGPHSFHSYLELRQRKSGKLIGERFGPLRFDMELNADERSVTYTHKRTKLFGLPWPHFLGPRISASERAEGDRFLFDVRAAHPLIGLIVHYSGWLLPIGASAMHLGERSKKSLELVGASGPTWPY